MKAAKIEELINKVVVKVVFDKEKVIFECDDGCNFLMTHQQQCCEFVELVDGQDDLYLLNGQKILMAEEVTQVDYYTQEDWRLHVLGLHNKTWTFYKLGAINGYVNLRWFGQSNGCYSERVDLFWIKKEEYCCYSDRVDLFW
jgi:hypothetical protein